MSRHSHGSESSREPSSLSTSKTQRAASTPVQDSQKEKLEENEKEQETYDSSAKEQTGQDYKNDQEQTRENLADDKGGENAKDVEKDSVKDETYNREGSEDEQENIRDDRSDNEKENLRQENGYEAEAEGDDQPEDPGSPPPEVQEQSPEDFESQPFLHHLSELSDKLNSDRYQTLNENFPVEELKGMVNAVVRTMDNFRDYSKHSQKQMESIRDQMKDIRERAHKKIAAKPYDPNTSGRVGYEERELENKLAQLNKEIARASEELARASAMSAETEAAAIEASLAAERAAEEAKQLQESYEARRRAEAEARKEEEERKEAQEKKRKEEEEKMREEMKKEDERQAKLKKPEEKPPVWQDWPVLSYSIEPGEFDQGVGCLIRADESKFQQSSVQVEAVDQMMAKFVYGVNEELIGNFISISPAGDETAFSEPIFVALPHCISRASAMTREPVVKAFYDDQWNELKSQETTFDDHKELKFVQAELHCSALLTVVSRYKRDYLTFGKRGGKVTSNIDSRITLTAERNIFPKREHFVIQLQPVDSASISDIKTRQEGKGLFSSSAIVNMGWTSKSFEEPIVMTLPCPPNPAKAKKAAAARAAKEAKMKNPGGHSMAAMEESRKKEDKQEKVTNRWYMGEYGTNEDDENDLLYFVRKTKMGRWVVAEDINVTSPRLDVVQFDLQAPIDRFMVLRTRTNVNLQDAQQFAVIIETYLNQRIATAVLKQKSEEPCSLTLHVVPAAKAERVSKKLTEDGWDDGPGVSSPFNIQEGDVLELGFRGNIKLDKPETEEESKPMLVVYNSQLTMFHTFDTIEVDKFLQRNYTVYRGFVTLQKKTEIIHPPDKDEEGEDAEPTVEVKYEPLCDFTISIPKEPATEPKPLVRAPVVIKPGNDPITDDVLKEISADLGDEWQRVANALNVKKVRIQAIMKKNVSEDDDDVKYDMLITWAKKVPRGLNKAGILKTALTRSGRYDLAEKVENIYSDFQASRKDVPGQAY